MNQIILLDDMGVDNVGFLVENLGADAAPLQYLRELVQNELEAIERDPSEHPQIEIDWEEVEGVRKLRITGNGEGMTPDEVASNINRLSASGGIQAFDKNFGIGAKITAATRNPHGVMYKAWKNWQGSLTVLARVDSRFGRMGFPNEEDGTVDYWLPLPDEDKPAIIRDHGVSVVLLGRSAEEDTTTPPPGADLPSQWVAAYLERRYFQLPPEVTVRVKRLNEIYDSQLDLHREIYDTIRGQRFHLDKHSDARGTLELRGARARVWWWLLCEQSAQTGRTWNNRGHVAALYQDELYEVRSGAARASALKDFGIYAGFGRIVLYVEPHNVLKANTARTSLILQGSQPVDYVGVGAAFAERMPEELVAFMAGQVSAERGDHRKAIRKNLKEVEQALKHARYRRAQAGPESAYDPEVGGRSSRTGESREPRAQPAPEPSERRRAEDAIGRIGTDYLRRAREERERLMQASKVNSDPTPQIVWDRSGSTVPAGRAATYTPRSHVVTVSARYSFYLDMVQWAVEEGRQRAAELDEDSIRSVAEDEVQRWFEQALTDCVVVLRPLAHDEVWGPMVYNTGLSDEGLTAAVVSHRWHMMSAIKRGLAGRLGRSRDG
jgi:hypothetical protein